MSEVATMLPVWSAKRAVRKAYEEERATMEAYQAATAARQAAVMALNLALAKEERGEG